MRRLGQALGRDPMSIYRHAANRNELLAGVAELMLDELEVFPDDTNWQEQLRRIAHALRRVCLRHPNAVPLLVTGPLSTPLGLRPAGTLRPLEQVMGILIGWIGAREATRALIAASSTWLEPHLVPRLYGLLVDAAVSPGHAVRIIERADSAMTESGACPPCSIGFQVAAAMSYATAGREDAASCRLAKAEQLAGMWPGGPWHAAVWETRGLLRLAEGHDDQANALFHEAAATFAELGRLPDELRCLARAAHRSTPTTSG
ncbi:hypothetical protein GCM10027405_30620 [Arthrobacter alkaliphilus]|uniref:TetR/AcrR family transcriptional regulator n=1 Tax=Arthrobacter alkaliphilus TaxID=369936 RepID=UPI0027E002AD|nr:TetR/AcrR family transcriptional regulator C-terminal domain-containing protein [Arthrobacter alkaliphilus]